MRIRDKTWSDYKITKERVKELNEYCQKTKDISLVKKAVEKANSSIAQELLLSLTKGISFEKLTFFGYVPICQKDFYGYRRCALAILHELLLELK